MLVEEARVLLALADALGAAQEVLRARAESTMHPVTTPPSNVVDLARQTHPLLGPRQAQILSLLAEGPAQGLSSGDLGRQMSYDQPNVYLTLQQLARRGFVHKDATSNPHLYRLTDELAQAAAGV